MPIRYVPYAPEPVEGQALLRNVVRTRRLLTYTGSDGVERRIARGLPLYDVETVETVGEAEAAGQNAVLSGSCLAACAWLKDRGEEVDLVYIDPPFASGADFAKRIYLRRNPKAAEAATRAEEQQLDFPDVRSFEETMYGDIWNKEDYLNWMYENLVAIRSVMSDTASLYLHIDWHIGPYVKVLLDEIFGESNFQSEIVWKRTSAHSDAETYGVNHDTIFFYTKGPAFTFNEVFQPYTEEYLARFKRYDEAPDGTKRYWTDDNLSAKGLRGRGYDYAYKGVRGYWRCPEETMAQLDAANRLLFTRKGGIRRKRYKDEMPGMPAQALWDDIPPVNSQAAERVDYPTQKPRALLERVLTASSDAGMLVADFFGGSGTTAEAAHRLGRRFVTSDVGLNSFQTTRDRLRDAGAAFEARVVRDGVALFRNPTQTMDRLATLIPGLRRGGVPAPWFGLFQDAALGAVPVHVPNLLDSGSRVLDAPALYRLVQTLGDLDAATKRAVVYYVDAEDAAELDRVLAENPTAVEVELRDLKELLAEAVVEDDVTARVEEAEGGGFVVHVERFVSDRLRAQIAAYNEKRALPKAASLYDDAEAEDTDETADAETPAPKKKTFTPIEVSDAGLELVEYVSVDATAASGPWTSSAEVRVDKKGFVVLDGKKTKAFWDGAIRSSRRPLRVKVRSISGDETVVALGGDRTTAQAAA